LKSMISLIVLLLSITYSFAAELTENRVNSFMGEWFEAQNTGTYSKYAAMYSKRFIGIRRSGSETHKFDYDAWLRERKRMFRKKMIVSGGVLEIKLSDTKALIKFEQTWESSTYKDEGVKLINLAIENGKLKIVREELLSSKFISAIDVEDSEISTVTIGATPDGKGNYTSFKYKDCWKPKGYFARHFVFDERSRECPGLKG
jgi:hypothetical protein